MAKWQANHGCDNVKFTHQNLSHKCCDWHQFYIVMRVYCYGIDLDHILTLVIVVLGSYCWPLATIPAVCLHVIINSCMKWLNLKRPWLLFLKLYCSKKWSTSVTKMSVARVYWDCIIAKFQVSVQIRYSSTISSHTRDVPHVISCRISCVKCKYLSWKSWFTRDGNV